MATKTNGDPKPAKKAPRMRLTLSAERSTAIRAAILRAHPWIKESEVTAMLAQHAETVNVETWIANKLAQHFKRVSIPLVLDANTEPTDVPMSAITGGKGEG